MNKILITGATGNLGKAVANELIAKGVTNVSVMARDLQKAEEFKAKGVEVVYGDYNDYDSLVKAFTNVDTLYFVSASDVTQRYTQQENVVKAGQRTDPMTAITRFINFHSNPRSSMPCLYQSTNLLSSTDFKLIICPFLNSASNSTQASFSYPPRSLSSR